MLDMEGILKDYRPLQLNTIGDVYDTHEEHGEHTPYMNEYSFIWEPTEEENGTARQLYSSNHSHPIYFKTKRVANLKSDLQKKLKGEKLRLPLISKCRGSSNRKIMFNEEIANSLIFSPILGVTRTPATLIDVVDDEHEGYIALSFHKALSYSRAQSRLEHCPVEQRPIICIALNTCKRLLLIHKTVLEKWQRAGVTDVAYEFEEEHLFLKKIMKEEYYFDSHVHQYFSSINDFQKNKITDTHV